MGAGFKVEVSELDGLVRELHRSQEEMCAAPNVLRDTGPKTTGGKELDNACDEFHESWDDAIKMIADGTQVIECKLQADSRHVLGRRGGHPGRLRRHGWGAVSDQHPALGFGSVPGDSGNVGSLAARTKTAATAVDTAQNGIKRLTGNVRRAGDGASAYVVVNTRVLKDLDSLKAAVRPHGSLDPLSWWAKGPALAPSLPGTVSSNYDSVTGE
ncbi:hypothetical protein [Streptomyces chryseus]